jgi:very-short-patch-repair endonuclease
LELRRVVWEWDAALARLRAEQADLAAALERSCRPIAAERRPEGQLRLVLGCWWEPDLARLRQPAAEPRLDSALSSVLADQCRVLVVEWPGGCTTADTPAAAGAPDLLAGLPEDARREASGCESALQRHFFAEAFRQGLRPLCQHKVLDFRLDFAFPGQRVAAEVEGWQPPASVRGRMWRGEREQQLGSSGWRLLRFWGEEVLNDVSGCVGELRDALRRSG